MAGAVIFLRDGPDGDPVAHAPTELVGDPVRGEEPAPLALEASTPVSSQPGGPFSPIAAAVLHDAPLRDALAVAARVRSLRAWRTARGIAAIGLVPLLMLLELDRELIGVGRLRVARLFVDATLAVWVGYELTRKTPRRPVVTGAILACVALRYLVLATRVCGVGIHPAAYVAMGLAAATGLAFLATAPSRDRVALEVLDKLGIGKSDAARARASPPLPPAYVPAALAAAAGLPLALALTRARGASSAAQAVVFLGYALVVPPLVTRALGGRVTAPKLRIDPAPVAIGVLIGFVLAVALANGARCFFDAGAHLARCTGKLDREGRALLDSEARELARGLARAKSHPALLAMTTVVVPFAEERVYRGLVQRVLVDRYGAAYGVFASAFVFGLAHMGVYQVALYQTVLLGVAFGVAYLEGGLVAATLAHALWNLQVLL